jgi:transcriptional regulator with XRE-family HTH domain
MNVGSKIKKIRQLRGWTQELLAINVNLSTDRIKHYETGARVPKPAQLEAFASALGVPTEFLKDHDIDTCRDVEHVLLELESTFGLEIEEKDGKFTIDFADSELHSFLHLWAKAKSGSNTDSESKKKYELWKADYPYTHTKETEKKIKEIQRKNKEAESKK